MDKSGGRLFALSQSKGNRFLADERTEGGRGDETASANGASHRAQGVAWQSLLQTDAGAAATRRTSIAALHSLTNSHTRRALLSSKAKQVTADAGQMPTQSFPHGRCESSAGSRAERAIGPWGSGLHRGRWTVSASRIGWDMESVHLRRQSGRRAT